MKAGCHIAANTDRRIGPVYVVEDTRDEGEHISRCVAERVASSCYGVS